MGRALFRDILQLFNASWVSSDPSRTSSVYRDLYSYPAARVIRSYGYRRIFDEGMYKELLVSHKTYGLDEQRENNPYTCSKRSLRRGPKTNRYRIKGA